MKPKISIIVPVYNVEKYLSHCIDSILCQTYPNCEVILIDDGSTDSSGKICDEYITQNGNVRVLHKENEGVSAARNLGVSIATGDYIGFVDADDYIEPNMYTELYNSLQEKQADLVICCFDYVDEQGDVLQGTKTCVKDELCAPRELYGRLSLSNDVFYVTPVNRLYKREILEKVKFPRTRHEDEFTAHHFFDACKSVEVCGEILYHYVQHNKSFMSSNYSVEHFAIVDAMLDRYYFMIERGYRREAQAALNKGYLELVHGMIELDWESNKELIHKKYQLVRSALMTEKDFHAVKLVLQYMKIIAKKKLESRCN